MLLWRAAGMLCFSRASSLLHQGLPLQSILHLCPVRQPHGILAVVKAGHPLGIFSNIYQVQGGDAEAQQKHKPRHRSGHVYRQP